MCRAALALTPDVEMIYAFDSPLPSLKADLIAVDARSSPSYCKQAKLMKEAIQRIQARSLQNLFNTRLERLQGLVFTGERSDDDEMILLLFSRDIQVTSFLTTKLAYQ
jgi:hypothetical protein